MPEDQSFYELSQSWTQFIFKGKRVNRIRIGKDSYLTKCPSCLLKTSFFHSLGCPLEINPCPFCEEKYAVDCKCSYYKD